MMFKVEMMFSMSNSLIEYEALLIFFKQMSTE